MPAHGSSNLKQSPQQRARLRICASCMWVFLVRPPTDEDPGWDCPKCEFATYGARSVLGRRAYRHLVTQESWLERKLDRERSKLLDIVTESHKTLPEHHKPRRRTASFFLGDP